MQSDLLDVIEDDDDKFGILNYFSSSISNQKQINNFQKWGHTQSFINQSPSKPFHEQSSDYEIIDSNV